jgi:hypothetical protein
MPRRDLRVLPALVLCTTAAAARLMLGPQIVDDAFITMRYSRNLAASGAMSYNPPDPVLGTSTPLWTLVLAGGEVGGVAPETTAVVVSSLADGCSILLILAAPAGGSLAALAAAATIAAWPAYVTYAVSGMETSLYVLIIVTCLTAMTRNRTALSAAAASLGALCRPDGALLVVLGFVWTLVTASRQAAARYAAVAAVVAAPWAAYAYVRFGSMIPSSVTAKAAATDPWFVSLQNVAAYFFHGIYLPMTLLALVGCGVVLRRREGFWRAWTVWGLAYLIAMTAMNGFTHFPWYFVPLLPIYSALAIEGAGFVWTRVAAFVRNGGVGDSFLATPVRRTAAAVLLSAALLSRMTPLKAYLRSAAEGREKLYASVAANLAGVDAHCTVAATEIGAIGYYYPGRVLDLAGLVSPEAVGRPVNDVLAHSQARWLVTYDTHFNRDVVRSEAFAKLFERRSVVRVSESRALEVYERRDPVRCGA